ncbi:hypothetical protein [Actinomadura macrotermitis]|uniref:Lipoprotein n=1 Tax=Actinomadura macrotermitis TaxID=2585200 RepID=A0A7K0BX39_9ACTN|nr:hypothetical protein [Actinomadura macrotermitis]MQY05442.1 hypothetical protein [Actinomadura macrotermitis]
MITRLPAVVALLLGAGACASAPRAAAPQTAEPRVTATSTPASGADLGLPLDAYDLTPQESLQIERAKGMFLQACMKRYGFDLAVPQARVPAYPKNVSLLAWLGYQQVGRYGYQGPPGFNEEVAAASRNGRRGITVPPEQLPVFDGTVASFKGRPVPEGGCDGDLERRLSAGTDDSDRDIEALQQEANEQASEDGRFRQVMQAWSACMARAGLRYTDPEDAEGDPRWSSAGEDDGHPAPSAIEVRTAVTDERCRLQVNLSGVLQSLISAYEQRLIAQDGAQIRRIQDQLKQRVRNAAAMTMDPHPR